MTHDARHRVPAATLLMRGLASSVLLTATAVAALSSEATNPATCTTGPDRSRPRNLDYVPCRQQPVPRGPRRRKMRRRARRRLASTGRRDG